MIIKKSITGRRNENQDRHDISENSRYKILAIYDGHGGSIVSEFLKKYANKILIKELMKDRNICSSGRRAYNLIAKKLHNTYGNNIDRIGSTSLHIIIDKHARSFSVINTGDCKSVICYTNGSIKQLNCEHKPNKCLEKQRIEKLGGKIKMYTGGIYRIKGMAVSRSFGDYNVAPFLTHNPTIKNWESLKNVKFIILASDGLWDVNTNKDVTSFITLKLDPNRNKSTNPTKIISDLIHNAYSKGSMDNITAILYYL